MGHVGVAMAAKSRRPDMSLGGLILASYALEPFRHRLATVVILAVLASLGYFVVRRDRGGAALIGLLVLSHLPLDLFTSPLTLTRGGPVVGLEMYRRPVVDFVAEAALIGGGWLAYRRRVKPVTRTFGAMLLVALAAQVAWDSLMVCCPTALRGLDPAAPLSLAFVAGLLAAALVAVIVLDVRRRTPAAASS